MKQLNLIEMSQEDTRLLNTLFEKNSNVYTEMIDDLSRKWGKSLYWWATCLASRNPWLSSAYRDICIVLLAIQRVEQDGNINKVLVPCEEMKCVLQSFFNNKNRAVEIVAEKGETKFNNSEFILQFSKNIFIKKCVKKFWKEQDAIHLDDRIVLLDTEILASHIKKGIYKDRLFDDIEKLTDKKIVFMPQLVDDIAADQRGLIKKMGKYRNQNTVLKEHFLVWQDYLKLMKIPIWNRRFCEDKKLFNDIDVTPIVNRDIKHSMSAAQTQECILKYQLIRRMRKRKIAIETLVGWYEGQPSSMGLFAAYNKMYKKGKSVGCIGFALDDNWLSLAPSKEQTKQKIAPRQIGVIGRIFLGEPKRFCGEVGTVLFPAFRIKPSTDNLYGANENSVLVALSYEEFTSCRILKMIKEIEGWLRVNRIKVYIKNHPQLSNRSLKDYGINELNCEYAFLHQTFQEAIERADIVITAKSTTSYETVLSGKKVIVLGMTGDITFTYMPEEWKGKRYGIAYNGQELIDLITDFSNKIIDKLHLSRDYLVLPRKEALKNIL